jgi:hypothetical protein
MDSPLRYYREELVKELEKAGGRVTGTSVRCPFHEDKSASGSIHQDDTGVWRYTCHGGLCGASGDIYDIQARRTGRTMAEVLKSSPETGQTRQQPKYRGTLIEKKVFKTISDLEKVLPTIEKRYDYAENGKTDLIVYRCRGADGKKTFRQAHPVEGGYVLEAPPKPWPLFARRVIRDAQRVIVVEGEKCADALLRLGFAATTSPCGAGKAAYADWSILAGKEVILWPDNDEPGRSHMKDIETILQGMNPSPTISLLVPEALNLREKGDAADYVAEYVDGGTDLQKQAVECALQEVRATGPTVELEATIEATIRGERRAIPFPWPRLSMLSRAILPGTVTVLCGDPGSSKSFMLLEAMAYWFDQEIPIALYELEEDRSYHLNRALAQKAELSNLFDDNFVETNPDLVREVFRDHRPWLDRFGKRIWEAPDKQLTLDQITEWIRGRCEEGCRIIAIDPVTAAVGTDKPWLDDLKFIMDTKTIARKYKTSIILVTHPRKGRKQTTGMDEMAGGAGYQRFSQTILWLVNHDVPEKYEVASSLGGTMEIEANRQITLLKARNGSGHGVGIAFNFQGRSLTFHEFGPIKKKPKARKQ